MLSGRFTDVSSVHCGRVLCTAGLGSVHSGRVLCTAGLGSVHSGRVLCTADEFCAPRAWVPCTATPSTEGSHTRAVAAAVCWIVLPGIQSTTREHGIRTTLPPSRRARSCVGAREGALMG